MPRGNIPSDFELRIEVQTYASSTGNSGIQVRSRYGDQAGWLDGPQVDINPAGPWRNGFIYDETKGVQVWLWLDVRNCYRGEDVWMGPYLRCLAGRPMPKLTGSILAPVSPPE